MIKSKSMFLLSSLSSLVLSFQFLRSAIDSRHFEKSGSITGIQLSVSVRLKTHTHYNSIPDLTLKNYPSKTVLFLTIWYSSSSLGEYILKPYFEVSKFCFGIQEFCFWKFEISFLEIPHSVLESRISVLKF